MNEGTHAEYLKYFSEEEYTTILRESVSSVEAMDKIENKVGRRLTDDEAWEVDFDWLKLSK